MLGDISFKRIDEEKDDLIRLARKIWENPEQGNREFIASDACTELLEKAGFEVERDYGGLPTALRAVYGSGHPVIGLLGEFDALPGLSQKDVCYRDPVVEGGWGHGCGHCLMCSANIGALIALRDEMEAKKLKGTIVFYACPAEETVGGKGAMASGGAFKELDIALCWHPGKFNRSSYSLLTGANSQIFKFYGKSAHAACDPQLGRSALDAVELMDVAANYLREHVPQDVRIHYCIINGGSAPNVVPDYAAVKYTFRALDINTMMDVEKRLHDIAKGAALMTGTRVEVERLGGCYPVLNNHVVADVVDECMRTIPMEEWSTENIEYARKLNETIPEEWKASVAFSKSAPDTQLHVGVMPIDEDNDYGSSDLGDVSHICPSCFYKGACFPIGANFHSWQVAAVTGMEIGFKSMINGARMTALTALRFLTEPELVEKAKEEFARSMTGKKYETMLPDKAEYPPRPVRE
ncbi:amidohydrolase [Lacrimispora sp. 210928-DFI.3.58]|uniref:amidohydrolase n=1 Tax=Lacrimispora sp. 210928-DFI.3.58 TaxID=2883214 RepID=UPI001D076980|nr:amidohydrolase [Lacrimispora sp. 210928-DFI.3.58]MCB7317286.1 amidohydrolase [Lacrimispora sp. 210928-DFI.3.58]